MSNALGPGGQWLTLTGNADEHREPGEGEQRRRHRLEQGEHEEGRGAEQQRVEAHLDRDVRGLPEVAALGLGEEERGVDGRERRE